MQKTSCGISVPIIHWLWMCSRFLFADLPCLLTILDGTNIFNAGHNFRFRHCIHFGADLLKPAIFAFLETFVILAVSDQHSKFRLVADNFHRHFSFVNKNPCILSGGSTQDTRIPGRYQIVSRYRATTFDNNL